VVLTEITVMYKASIKPQPSKTIKPKVPIKMISTTAATARRMRRVASLRGP
jgi:hypothetical protein